MTILGLILLVALALFAICLGFCVAVWIMHFDTARRSTHRIHVVHGPHARVRG